MLTQNPEMLELERGLRDHWIQLSLWGSWGPKGRWHAQYWFKGVHTHTPHTHSPTCSHTAGPLSSVNSPRVIVSSGEEGALLFIFVFYLIFSQLHQSLIDKNCIYVSGVHDVLIYGYVVKECFNLLTSISITSHIYLFYLWWEHFSSLLSANCNYMI